VLIGISIILDIFSPLVCVLLSINRSRMFVAATFIYSVISIAQIPVVYFIAVIVHPLINMPGLHEAAAQFPHLYYTGLFFNNIIVTICCFLAAHWLRKTQIKPPLKFNVFFSLLFVLFALIVLLWWSDIVKIMTISFLPSALLGTLLLGILLLLFYLYTRLVIKTESLPIVTNANAGEYAQFVKQLSRRELEVVEAILVGNVSHKELSATLNISVNTVKTHLKHIYKTTGVSSIEVIPYLFRGFTQNHPQITFKSPQR